MIEPNLAREILDSKPEYHGTPTGRFYEAVIENKLAEYYLSEFIQMRDDYSDELPDTDVRYLPIMENPDLTRNTLFKCQGNFISKFSLRLQSAVEYGIITDSELVGNIDNFVKSNLEFIVGDKQNIEKLAIVNNLLAAVISYLERKVEEKNLHE